MQNIRIIHLSDLHYKATAEDDRRLDALLDEINLQLRSEPSVLIFSGDLTDTGSQEQHELLAERFLVRLDGYEKVFMCPGNHDVIRTRTGTQQIDEAAAHAATLREYPSNWSPFKGDCPQEYYFATQEIFSDFTTSNFFASHAKFDNYEIVAINTAWRCKKHPEGYSDRGTLSVNQRSIDLTLAKLSQHNLRILVMHHPLSWLDEASQKYLQDVCAEHFDIVLFGHEHDPITLNQETGLGSTVFLEATAAKADWSNGLNGYSIINANTKNKAVKVKYRQYAPSRKEFMDGHSVTESSIRYPRQADRDFWEREQERNAPLIIEKIRDSLKSDAIEELTKLNFNGKSEYETNPLEANFKEAKFIEGEKLPTRRKKVTRFFESLSRISFFVGPKDSGLTTAAQIAFRHLCEKIDKTKLVPVFVNLEETSSLHKGNIPRVLQRAFQTRISPAEAETLLTEGNVVFIFDCISIHDKKKIEAIRSTFDRYFSEAKLAFFCSLDRRNSTQLDDEMLNLDPEKDRIFEICELSVPEIRNLINIKAKDQSAEIRENLLNNAITSFTAMAEPVYASTVSLLVETLKQLPNFRPINRVRLLDRYIECILGRYTLEDLATGEFNSSEKSNLLSYIAGKMIEKDVTSFSHDEMEDTITAYSQNMLLEVPKDILEELCEKGILVSNDNRYTFRTNAIFSYFVAKDMVRTPSTFKSITSTGKFFSHSSELVFYGELEGVDSSALLNIASEYVRDLGEIIKQQYADNGISFSEEWQKMIAASEDDSPLLQETLEEVASQFPSEVSRDESRHRELYSSIRARGVPQRATVKELEAKWLVAIRVYLQLLKYSSSIPGVERLSHLKTALASLEDFAHGLAVKREQISSSPAFSHGGVLYINPMARIDPERSRREYKVNAPASISSMASELMGTPQLSVALLRAAEEGTEFMDFVIRNLLMDIPSKESAKFITDSIIDSETSALQIASLRTLKNKYIDYKTTKIEEAHHRLIIESLNKERSVRPNLNINEINRKKYIATLKGKDEDS